MNQQAEDAQNERVTRIIDLKIPLTWLLGITGGLAWVLISMWFSVNQLNKAVEGLTKALENSTSANTITANELLVLKFRVTNLEDENKRQAERLAKIGIQK